MYMFTLREFYSSGYVRFLCFKLFIEKITDCKQIDNMKNTVKLNEARIRKIVAESVKRVLNEMKWNTIEGLAHDLCDGFEDTFDERTMIRVIQQILSEGEYTLEDLLRMNNEDSNLVYDIISDYYPR